MDGPLPWSIAVHEPYGSQLMAVSWTSSKDEPRLHRVFERRSSLTVAGPAVAGSSAECWNQSVLFVLTAGLIQR
jgi:hypothetical protein